DEGPEDSLHNRGFSRVNFALPTGLTLQHPHYAVAVADAARRHSRFHATPEASSCLLRQVVKIQGIHGALEADVQVSDIAFRDRDDPDASEGQPLEQARGVFLVA